MTRIRLSAIAMLVCVIVIATAGAGLAQYGWWDEPQDDRGDVPSWENNERFKHDVFTFVRIQYDSGNYRRRNREGGFGWFGGEGETGGDQFRYRRRRRWGGGWRTDYPDSDLNFSFRLQQLTSLKVNPKPIYLRLTDERLFDYPFIYIIEPGRLYFSDAEVKALRRYLTNGGFLMVDDFWGDYEWENFYQQMKRVFPKREPLELPLEHEIFHCVYRLKEKPQVPSIHAAWRGQSRGVTWEEGHGGDTRTVHYKGIFDDNGRMMAIICHNTDLGDGWEREGVEEWYFNEFSQKKAYPMGINIVVYAMTH